MNPADSPADDMATVGMLDVLLPKVAAWAESTGLILAPLPDGPDGTYILVPSLNTQWVEGTTRPLVDHTYLSSACRHRLHGRCHNECTFCLGACVCFCHGKPTGGASRAGTAGNPVS